MFDQRRCPPLHSFCVCADYSICMWLGNTITILCPHLLLFLSLCGGDCIYLFHQSVDIPLAKTEIPTWDRREWDRFQFAIVQKQRSSWMSKENPIQKQKEERKPIDPWCVYTAAFFFRKRSCWCSNWRKNKERQVFWLFPFLLLHDRTPVRPFLFEETYSLFSKIPLLYYKERIPAR